MSKKTMSSEEEVTQKLLHSKFPEGLRVLAVDADISHLLLLEGKLRSCLYDVTTCQRAHEALCLLREKNDAFDVLLMDIDMVDMDGLIMESSLPTVVFSSCQTRDGIMNALTKGACASFAKPVSMEAVNMLWQYVVSEKLRKRPYYTDERSTSSSETMNEEKSKHESDHHCTDHQNHGSSTSRKRNKPRMHWSLELQAKFNEAVRRIGIDDAVPKRIQQCMQRMGVVGITRENISSHLQKYRMELKKQENQQPPLKRQKGCSSSAVPLPVDAAAPYSSGPSRLIPCSNQIVLSNASPYSNQQGVELVVNAHPLAYTASGSNTVIWNAAPQQVINGATPTMNQVNLAVSCGAHHSAHYQQMDHCDGQLKHLAGDTNNTTFEDDLVAYMNQLQEHANIGISQNIPAIFGVDEAVFASDGNTTSMNAEVCFPYLEQNHLMAN